MRRYPGVFLFCYVLCRSVQHAVIPFGKDKCQNNSHNRCQRQAGNGNRAVYGNAVTADSQNQDDSGYQQVAAVAEVQPGVNQDTHAYCGNHAVKHDADAAGDGRRDTGDESAKFSKNTQNHGKYGRDADNRRVIYLGYGQNARIFPIGCIGRAAQKAGQRGCKAVAQDRSVNARIHHEVLAYHGAVGCAQSW